MTDTLERVQTYKQFIGGEFVDAEDGRTAEVINPANDEAIASVPASSAEYVDRAVDAAEQAFATWRARMSVAREKAYRELAERTDRSAARVGEALERTADELSELRARTAEVERMLKEVE